jgi:Ca2+-binding EF-hand superfamily protein
MAKVSSKTDADILKEKFTAADVNGNGSLSIKEFKSFLETLGFENKQLNKSILRQTDSNHNKQISFEGLIKIRFHILF